MARSTLKYILLGLAVAGGTLAGPAAVRTTGNDYDSPLSTRVDSISIGSFDLSRQWTKGYEFFNIYMSGSEATPDGQAVTKGATFSAKCVDCYTYGKVALSTSGATYTSIWDEITEVLDPANWVVQYLDLDLKISFENVGAYFEVDFAATGVVTKTYTLFSLAPSSPTSAGSSVTIGANILIQLVVTIEADIELTAGFEIQFPEGAYLLIDPVTGAILESSGFKGGDITGIPITVVHGDAKLTAALKVVAEVGLDLVVGDTQLELEVGAFAMLPEYVATVSTDASCGGNFIVEEDFYVVFGAFANFVAAIDYLSFAAVPTAKTTVYTHALPSICEAKTTSAKATTTSSSTSTAIFITSGAAQSSGSGASSTLTSSSAAASSAAATSTISTYCQNYYDSCIQASVLDPDFALCASEQAQCESCDDSWNTCITTADADFADCNSEQASCYDELPGQSSSSSSTSSSYRSSPTSATVPYPYQNSSSTYSSVPMTTSTVFVTSQITITSCAATVTDCPARPSLATEIFVTDTVFSYTTVCPVTQEETATAGSSQSQPTITNFVAPPPTATYTGSVTPITQTQTIVWSQAVTTIVGSIYVPTIAASAVVGVPGANGSTAYTVTYISVTNTPTSLSVSSTSIPAVTTGVNSYGNSTATNTNIVQPSVNSNATASAVYTASASRISNDAVSGSLTAMLMGIICMAIM